jgi:16S rRNA (cytidine1402-2'-O)-methyltransferase
MWIQKSYSNDGGSLYIVPTPIGNLEDITLRAIRMLKEVDWIAAEDTRQTKKLTNHFEIDTPLLSYHEHNKFVSGEKIINYIKEGQSVALVSDAGMPGISDPGYELITSCILEQIPVIPLPGANAALPSLVASGIPTDHFYFHGFLPRDKKGKKKDLEDIKVIQHPIIIYESPHRLKDTLLVMNDILGNRTISLTRELSKKFEEFIRGTLSEVLEWASDVDIRGEFCIIVEGNKDAPESITNWWEELTIEEHVAYYIETKEMDSKSAVKQTSIDRGLPKREVYQKYHIK